MATPRASEPLETLKANTANLLNNLTHTTSSLNTVGSRLDYPGLDSEISEKIKNQVTVLNKKIQEAASQKAIEDILRNGLETIEYTINKRNKELEKNKISVLNTEPTNAPPDIATFSSSGFSAGTNESPKKIAIPIMQIDLAPLKQLKSHLTVVHDAVKTEKNNPSFTQRIQNFLKPSTPEKTSEPSNEDIKQKIIAALNKYVEAPKKFGHDEKLFQERKILVYNSLNQLMQPNCEVSHILKTLQENNDALSNRHGKETQRSNISHQAGIGASYTQERVVHGRLATALDGFINEINNPKPAQQQQITEAQKPPTPTQKR